MSDEGNASGSGATPAANQTETEAMPADERQSAPPSGNLGSADPQAPTALVQSAVDGGVPRPATIRPGSNPGRPGSPKPAESAGEPQVTGDGGAPGEVATGPSGEVAT
jgi:hypothetical protein